jgi:NADH:ubiquinone oxidoreductase subunit D
MSRSVGIKRDLRLSKLETYANYYYINFRSYTGMHGDCYDRFLIRMNEMSESVNISNQIINKLTKFNIINFKNKQNKQVNQNYTTIQPHIIHKYISTNNFNKFNFNNSYTSMEHLIKHFKF